MKAVAMLKVEDLKNIKLLVFDVDGILVPRGTKIKQSGEKTFFYTKKIKKKQISQIKKLFDLGYHINISSGRGLYMLQKMFWKVLPYVSLTYENGSATWYKGKIYQHVNSYKNLSDLNDLLLNLKSNDIEGFEPKEFIITIHCRRRFRKIEDIVAKHKDLYTDWNGEAYDICLKGKQTKAEGLKSVLSLMHLKKKNTLFVGDNYNDRSVALLSEISVTADKKRFSAKFFVPLSKKNLPGGLVMQKILGLKKQKI
jgi:hydroxymethylpyrimidine pyrophosphatase-like HAD family hydrolase